MKLTWLWLSILIAGNAIAWTGYITNQYDQIYSIHPGSDLSGADFSGLNLTYAELEGANLSGANFNNSTLDFADLSGARLDEATFDGANLYATRLVNALLVDTSFISSQAKNADFSNAFGLFMVSSNSTFTAADFSKADMRYANLRDSVFDRADFSGSLLSNSTLTNNTYENTVFIGSDIENQFSASTNGVLTLDALTEDYITRDVAISNWVDSVFSTTDEVIGVSNAFIAADTVLSNVLTAADSNNYEALSTINAQLNTVSNNFDLTLSTSNYLANSSLLNNNGGGFGFLTNNGIMGFSNFSNSAESNNVIARIIDELSSWGDDHVYYEHRLGSGDNDKSRLTKVIEEVMGNTYSSASNAMNEGSYRPGQNLGDESQYGNSVSLVAKMAQELDGVNLDSNIGSNSTDIAMKRISQEFTSRELQFNTLSNNLQNSFGDMDFNDSAQYAYAAGVHQMVTNNIRSIDSSSNAFIAANTVLTSNVGTISNMMVDVKFESDNARTVLVEYVNSQLDGSIVSNNSAVSYGLEAAGSIGEFSSYNSLDGTKTNSTIERILQELAGSSIGTHIGDGGSAIDRLAQELDGLSVETNIGVEGSAIDRIAQELSGSYNTNAYYLGSGNSSDSAIDKIGQELSGSSLSIYNLGSGSEYESAIDIIAQELSGSYNLNASYLGSGNSSDSAIDKIAQELSGSSLPPYLQNEDPNDSAIDTIVQELSGSSLPSYLQTENPYDSAIDIIVQELMGASLYDDIGTSGTAMKRIGQEFSDTEEAANTLSNRVGMVSNYFASVISSATIDINSSFKYFTNAFGGEGVSSNINAESLASIINAQLDGSIVSNNTTVNYGLDAAGSIGEFSSSNLIDGIKTNSTIERILQELAGSSIATNIGVEGSAIDKIAQELDGSNYEILDSLYYGYSHSSNSVIDRLVQSLYYLDGYLEYELHFPMDSNIGNHEFEPNIRRIAQELDVNNHEQLTSLNVSVESSGSAVDILVDAVSELDSSLYQTQQTNHTQAVAIQSLNTATNDLYALIAALQNQITTLSSKVNALENHQNMGQTTNWWDDAENFENIASNLVDGRVGSTVVSVSRGQASLQMNLETTSNLTEGWEPATNVNVVIPVGESDSQFFRMGFE